MHRKRLHYEDTVTHMQLIRMATVNQEALGVEKRQSHRVGLVVLALGWLLLGCLEFAYECVVLLGLSIILITIRAVTRDLEGPEDRSDIASTEVAAQDTMATRTVPPLVGGSGEDWPKLYERLKLVNTKEEQEETGESYSAHAQTTATESLEAMNRGEKGGKEKAFSDYRKLCSS